MVWPVLEGFCVGDFMHRKPELHSVTILCSFEEGPLQKKKTCVILNDTDWLTKKCLTVAKKIVNQKLTYIPIVCFSWCMQTWGLCWLTKVSTRMLLQVLKSIFLFRQTSREHRGCNLFVSSINDFCCLSLLSVVWSCFAIICPVLTPSHISGLHISCPTWYFPCFGQKWHRLD